MACTDSDYLIALLEVYIVASQINFLKNNFEMYSPLVKHGGLIVFHYIYDISIISEGVNKFWNEVKNNYKFLEIVNNQKQGYEIGILFT